MDEETILLSNGTRVPVSRKRPGCVGSNQDYDEVERYKRPAIERVNNVWGSTAGAGSDFFHIYRKHRTVELERLRKMDEDYELQQDEEQFQKRREASIRLNITRSEKRATKRKQRKERTIQKRLEEKEKRITEKKQDCNVKSTSQTNEKLKSSSLTCNDREDTIESPNHNDETEEIDII